MHLLDNFFHILLARETTTEEEAADEASQKGDPSSTLQQTRFMEVLRNPSAGL